MANHKESILLIWLFVIFGILSTVYLYGGRYFLLAHPCMAIIAAKGLCDTMDWIKRGANHLYWGIAIALAVAFIITIHQTHEQYYKTFTLEKENNFEEDRMRGGSDFAQWLKSNYSPADTIVVLGDEINFCPEIFLANTVEMPFQFKYLTNHPDINQLECTVRDLGYKKAVYVMSGNLITSQTGIYNNPKEFFDAHPDGAPIFSYGYNKPLFWAFEVKL